VKRTGDNRPAIVHGKFIEREMSKLMRRPLSVRVAAGVIVTATAATVVIGGVLIRIFDKKDFPNVWVGMWWALQTTTTVGYGDVVPKTALGRVVGGVIMLEAIAFLAVITAIITSTFIERARRERGTAEWQTAEKQFDARFDAIDARLDQLEALIREGVETRRTPT
jgi:voltage-gated potassium channel Kch